jgi:hypothetical protein
MRFYRLCLVTVVMGGASFVEACGGDEARIAHVEALLQPYRHKEPPLLLPARTPAPRRLC